MRRQKKKKITDRKTKGGVVVCGNKTMMVIITNNIQILKIVVIVLMSTTLLSLISLSQAARSPTVVASSSSSVASSSSFVLMRLAAGRRQITTATTAFNFVLPRRNDIRPFCFTTRSHRPYSCSYSSFSSLAMSSSSKSTAAVEEASTKTKIVDDNDNDDDETQLVQDMLTRIRHINRMPNDIRSSLLDFIVDDQKLGLVHPKIAQRLCNIPHDTNHDNTDHDGGSVFVLMTDDMSNQYLTLNSKYAGNTVESRTEAVATVTSKLRKEGFITGWRDELFRVSETYYKDPIFLIERSACNILGVIDYGVHLNGLVKQQQKQQDPSTTTTEEQPPKMWIGRRSKSKSKFPGMLDHLVAGGLPADLSLMENVIKECEEEAGIPPELVKAGIRPVGAISYLDWESKTDKISRVVLFNYDLYLPSEFIPKAVDGEVEEFLLWTIDDVKESMKLNYHDPIKPNCYAVIIDYLLRNGYINPEIDGYLDILKELRSGDCQ